MNNNWDSLRLEIATSYVATRGTIRTVANKLGISKTTVHIRLREFINMTHCSLEENRLSVEAQNIIKQNTEERHLRGGSATKNKYAKLKQK